jgi:hypothetical protein
MSNKTSKRPPNELESRLHKAAISNQKNVHLPFDPGFNINVAVDFDT